MTSNERGAQWTKAVRHEQVFSEFIATLPPFGPIEEYNWFFQNISQWESQKNRFAYHLFRQNPVFTSLHLRSTVHVVPALMQDGQYWILPKEINADWFFWDSYWLEILKYQLCLFKGPNGGSLASASGLLNIDLSRSPLVCKNTAWRVQRGSVGCSVPQRVQRGSFGCSVAQLGAAWFIWVQHHSFGCSIAQWVQRGSAWISYSNSAT